MRLVRMKKVLVFDFGASSARAMLCWFDGKKICTEEIHRFPNTPVTIDGTLYWDIDYLFSETAAAMKKAVSFDAVSVDTWGVDFALIGEDNTISERPVHYRDARTEGIEDEVYKIIDEETLYNRTGILYMRFNTIFQLMALKKARPEALEGNKRLLMMPDLICHFLTGECKNEYCEATTTSLINPKTRNWDYDLIDMLDFPREIFGEIITAGEIYGFLKPEFTDRKIPVIASPSHDTASAVVAVPSTEKEFAFISCGTWTLFGTETETPIVTSRAHYHGLTNEGGHGNTTTFLKNIMGLWLLQECRRYYSKDERSVSFADMEKAARESEPYKAFINPNDDRFSMPGDMPEKILEAAGGGLDEGGIIRAVYDSLAFEFARTLLGIEEITGKTYPCVYMFGGGSRDSLLCQLTADATGRTVVAGPTEATAAGNAICALVKLGELESVEAARKIMRDSGETVEYKPMGTKATSDAFARYCEMLG